jgi:hypothetical protein
MRVAFDLTLKALKPVKGATTIMGNSDWNNDRDFVENMNWQQPGQSGYDRRQEQEQHGRHRGNQGSMSGSSQGQFDDGGFGSQQPWQGGVQRGGYGQQGAYGQPGWQDRSGQGMGSRQDWRRQDSTPTEGMEGQYPGGQMGNRQYGGQLGSRFEGGYRGGQMGSNRMDPPYGSQYGGQQGGPHGESQYGEQQGWFGQGFGPQNQGSQQGQDFGQQGSRWMSGPHTGRGPQGYRRSDERIEEDVCHALTMHGDVDATNIEVKVQEGEVTLSGTVSNRYEKRQAEDSLSDVTGVRDIHNQLRIQQEANSQQGQTARKSVQRETSGAGSSRN